MERESQNGDSGMAHGREHFIRFRSSKLRQSLSSQVTAISPLVDQLMMFIRNCRKTDGSELEIETAVREAISNAVIHGNHEDPYKRVRVMCRCNSDGEVRITVRDEGPGFKSDAVPDPTSPENRLSTHGRGIYLMRMLMDEVSFVKGGSVVRMRKKSNADAVTQRTERSNA
jgi:serine/threonine-protein kinase RsbW